jgi:hypothetical protein
VATVGDQLLTPETGWRRYDDTHAGLKYAGNWYKASNVGYYNGGMAVTGNSTNGNTVSFTFYGTKLRVLADFFSDRHSNNTITIDGAPETFNEYSASGKAVAIIYQKTDLPLGFHTVLMRSGNNRNNFTLDAIDIDETGYLSDYALTAPEAGWKRIDDGAGGFKRNGTWVYDPLTGAYQGAVRYTTDVNAKINFIFYGTKLRLLVNTYTNKPNNMPITIDDVTETYGMNNAGGQQVMVYEKSSLPLGYHAVSIQSPSNLGSQNWNIDAVDIDSTGRLYHPNEVTDMADIAVGKLIRCHYSSPASGTIGSFNNLGKETSDIIPVASSALPNGDFYFIATETVNQKIILVADRNVQHSISWDTLNNTGIASGTGKPLVHDVTSSIVSYYTMEEAETSNLFDSVGSSHGTATGTTIIAGMNGDGSARRLNGTSDCIRFASNPLIPTGKKSIRLKVRIPSVPTSIGYLLSNVDNSTTQQGLGMSVSTDGKLRVWGANASSGFRFDLTTPSSISDNLWHDVLFTWDGSTSLNGVKLYVDDMINPAVQTTSSSVETVYYTGGTTLGRLGGTATIYYLRCDLDSLEIYNDVINPSSGAPGLTNHKWTMRLLSGGVSSTDTDNEWNRYIVNSTLIGDNNIWNWGVNTVASMTSSSVSGTSANRVSRGYATVGGYYSAASSLIGATYGLRPVLVIEDLFKYDNTQLVSSITVPFRKDIFSIIYVYRDEYFDGITNITQRKAHLNVPYRNDLFTSITIGPNGYMTGNVVITPISWKYINSTIVTKLPSSIFGYISVKPHNKMAGTVGIFQPPITSVDLFPLQDAFVRSLIPRLNYGTEQEMLVGLNANTGEYYKSLIKFDISSIPPAQKIKSATVKIYYDDINNVSTNLNLYEALDSWTETGITWANTPAVGGKVQSVPSPSVSGYIEFDVKDNIADWYVGSKQNNGWIIDVDNATETYKFYTKERDISKPYISVEYFDPIAKSIGIVEIPSTIMVVQTKTKDVLSRITVKSSYTTFDFKGKIHVLNRDMLESFLGVNKPAMPSTIIVRRSTKIDTTATITIGRKEIVDLESNVKVSRYALPMTIRVRGNNSIHLTSSITVRRSVPNNQTSKIAVSRPWIKSSVGVVVSSYLGSTITVNRNDQKNLSSTITVKRSNISDITSSTSIWIPSLLQSSIYVLSGYLKSSIVVPFREKKDLNSRIKVREKFASDLLSYIEIYQFSFIDASISVVQNGGNTGFVIII